MWLNGSTDGPRNFMILFPLCLVLNNLQVRWHILRAKEIDRFPKMYNLIFEIDSARLPKLRRIQENNGYMGPNGRLHSAPTSVTENKRILMFEKFLRIQ